MNVKISIELTENQLEFAERLVREGNYASVSELVQEQIRDLMLGEDEKPADEDPVMAMKDEIRRRMELPDDQWLTEEEFEKHYEELLRRADAQIKGGDVVRYRTLPHPKLPSDFANILYFIGEYAGYTIARKKISEIKHTI